MASSKRIKGITVEIDGDLTKLDKALDGANKQLTTTQKALKDVERLLKLDPGNTELLEQKQRLLAQSVEATSENLNTLRQAAANADQALQRNQAYQEKYEPLKEELDQVAASMKALEANAASMQTKLESGAISGEQYDAFAQKLQQTRKRYEELETAAKNLEREFAGAKLDQGQYDALQRELAATETSLEELESQSNDSTSSLKKFGDAAGEVSTKAGKVKDAFAPVTKAIGAVTTAAVATVPATEEFRADLSMLDNNARQAGVGLEETRQAFKELYIASGETDSSVEAVSNLLQAGFTESNLQFAVEGLANAAATFPETLKIESLADSLQETLATGQATGQFGELLDRLGIGAESFSVSLSQCNSDLERQRLVLSTLVDGPLQGAYEGWKATNPELEKSRTATLDFKIAVSELAEAITPIITQITQWATQLMEWFTGLDSGAQGLIATVGLLLGAISPVAGAVSNISKLINTLSGADFSKLSSAASGIGSVLSQAMSGASGAVTSLATTIKTTLGGAFTFLASNPIVLAIAAIAAVVAVLVILWNTNEDFRNAVIGAWESITEAFSSFDEWLTGIFTTDWTENLGALGEILNSFFDTVSGIWNGIKQAFTGIIDFIAGVFTGDWERAWQGVVDIFGGIFETLSSIAKAPFNAVIGLINAMLEGITSAINGVINLLNSISIEIPDWVPIIGGNTLGFSIPQLTAPKIPGLAQGGVIPPNQPFLAMLGDNRQEPEIVAPYSTIKQAASEAMAEQGGKTGIQALHLYLHRGGGFMREFKFSLDSESKRQGVKLTEV